MSTSYLSTEHYHTIERQFSRSPVLDRRSKGYGYINAESASDNTDVDSDCKESEDEFQRKIRNHSFGEKVEEKNAKNKGRRKQGLFNGHSNPIVKEIKNGSSDSLHDNQNAHAHKEKSEKNRDRKHSHGNFSAIDHVKRKLSSTFTRRNSTSTSPEMNQRKTSLVSKSPTLVATSPDRTTRKNPFKSNSSTMVSGSPEMMARKAPLKSNSSSMVSYGTPNPLRRYALMMNNHSHDEPQRRSDSGIEKQSLMHPLVMSRKRSNRKQFESASNPDIVSTTPYENNGKMRDFNVYCLGTKQTGKTALAVRFLTGRYIHEYTSIPVEKYTRVMKYGGERVNVNIYISDTEKMDEDIELDSNSGIMIIYSITDRNSFKEAKSLLRHLKILTITDTTPVVLIATKVDLTRQRKVAERHASDLANEYNCSQFDVSAAIDDNVRQCFHATFKQIEVRHYLREHAIDDKMVLKAPTCSFRDSLDSDDNVYDSRL